ncbi:MAG: hypothetical protein K0U10_06655 [Gammaproteobacteria bacterium]|nr:hypothetical protein [Chlamydiales bacterium]MCH9690314.1 hypothetical protein [Gammaproteobacteria bacterium]
MEISEIRGAKAIGALKKKEGVQQTAPQDRLSISPESEKRAAWVEILKEMPDVRPEKIEVALQSSPSSFELAQKMLTADS